MNIPIYMIAFFAVAIPLTLLMWMVSKPGLAGIKKKRRTLKNALKLALTYSLAMLLTYLAASYLFLPPVCAPQRWTTPALLIVEVMSFLLFIRLGKKIYGIKKTGLVLILLSLIAASVSLAYLTVPLGLKVHKSAALCEAMKDLSWETLTPEVDGTTYTPRGAVTINFVNLPGQITLNGLEAYENRADIQCIWTNPSRKKVITEDRFTIKLLCPEKEKNEEYSLSLTIDYTLSNGTSITEKGVIEGTI